MPLSQYPLPPVSDLRLTVLFEANDATGYFSVHEHGFRGHGLVVKIRSQCIMNASLLPVGKAAIRFASGASWCSKSTEKSPFVTSRSVTSPA
jgi:hypothetical protein